MTSMNITLLSIQIRAAAATAKLAGLLELSDWLILVVDALEKKISNEFVK